MYFFKETSNYCVGKLVKNIQINIPKILMFNNLFKNAKIYLVTHRYSFLPHRRRTSQQFKTESLRNDP